MKRKMWKVPDDIMACMSAVLTRTAINDPDAKAVKDFILDELEKRENEK